MKQRLVQGLAILATLAILVVVYVRDFGIDFSWGIKPQELKYIVLAAALLIAALLIREGRNK